MPTILDKLDQDEEVAAMAKLYELLRPFDEHARRRMFEWANTKLLSAKRSAAARRASERPKDDGLGAAAVREPEADEHEQDARRVERDHNL